jgi:hypothetical protein
MRQRKKVVFDESINRYIFHTKHCRRIHLAWVGIAFAIFVGVCAYLSYTLNCGFASVPCQVSFYPHQG